jgi:hypothetical protein
MISNHSFSILQLQTPIYRDPGTWIKLPLCSRYGQQLNLFWVEHIHGSAQTSQLQPKSAKNSDSFIQNLQNPQPKFAQILQPQTKLCTDKP